MTLGSPGETTHYPNIQSCLLVYGDGRYGLRRQKNRQTVSENEAGRRVLKRRPTSSARLDNKQDMVITP